jgi:membrane-bound lytic murein transglycosylase D
MRLIAPALIFCGAAAFGQSPQVPHKMNFAGMTLSIRDDARRDIQNDVDMLTKSPKYFGIKVERARTYFPIIEKVFAEERLPDDFKYLSLQESALIPDAVSSSNAVGFWQFKDLSAQEVGLRVDNEVDERMHIEAASRGAARYLKKCNHYFNNWLFALQAYQMGAGDVMRSVGDKDLGTRHMEITPETYWYVRKYIAHKVAFEDAVKGAPSMEVSVVTAPAGATLEEIAYQSSCDIQEVRDFNKWLKADRIPGDREYSVILPKGKAIADFGVLVMASSPIKAVNPATTIVAEPEETEEPEINGLPIIRARKGEGLQALARRGDVGLSTFLHYNEIEIDAPVIEGQPYFLRKKKRHSAEELYTVKPGESLWTISQRFGVQSKSILRFNDLKEGQEIAPGITLFLSSRKPEGIVEDDHSVVAKLDEDESFDWGPAALDGPSSRAVAREYSTSLDKNPALVTLTSAPLTTDPVMEPFSAEVHEVKPSDTLYSVARQYGVTIKELMDWNDKKDFSLTVGEKLRVRSH